MEPQPPFAGSATPSQSAARSIWPAAFSVAVATLVVSNLWWIYNAIDHTATHKAQDDEQWRTCAALKQSVAILPPVSSRAAPAAIVDAARAADPDHLTEPFEKDGDIVVGHLVLRFNEAGQIVHVEPGWYPFECHP
jgi:hypothetical protein